MKITTWHGSLFLLVSLQITAAGADESLAPEEMYYAPIPQVVSAARLEKSLLDVGVSVTIIDREMIAASTALEIPDLLRLVPGFQVAHATGAVFAATYHGAGDQWPRRMEVMVDGRSVYLNTNSAVEWSALGLAIEDIERIEVVRGANAPSFGGNAVQGSINIVTRAPFLLSGKYLRGTLGSQDTGIGVARWAGSIADWETSLTAQYREDHGFDQVNDHKRLTDLRVRSDYQATTEDNLSIQLGLTDGEVGVDGKADDYFEPFRDREIRSHYQQLTWNREQYSGDRFRLQFYHHSFKHDDSYAPDITSFGFPQGTTLPLGLYVAESKRYDLEFQHTLTPRDNWRLAWGLGGRYDALSSDLMLGERGEVNRYSARLFGSFEWSLARQLMVGLDFLTELHEYYGTETSPRLAINWRPTDSRSFRASASRSYRVFTLLERFIDYPVKASDGTFIRQLLLAEGEDDFTPERVTGYEIGYTEQWRDLGLLLDLRLFHEELEDSGYSAYQLDPNSPNLMRVWDDEGGGWDVRGFELQLDYQPMRNTRLVGAYAYADINGQVGIDNQYSDYESLDDSAPQHTLSLLLNQRFTSQWWGSLVLYHMDDMRWRGEGSEVEDYTRLDLKLAYDLVMTNGEGQIALIVHNLTDEVYSEFRVPGTNDRDGNLFERRAFIQASLRFD